MASFHKETTLLVLSIKWSFFKGWNIARSFNSRNAIYFKLNTCCWISIEHHVPWRVNIQGCKAIRATEIISRFLFWLRKLKSWPVKLLTEDWTCIYRRINDGVGINKSHSVHNEPNRMNNGEAWKVFDREDLHWNLQPGSYSVLMVIVPSLYSSALHSTE